MIITRSHVYRRWGKHRETAAESNRLRRKTNERADKKLTSRTGKPMASICWRSNLLASVKTKTQNSAEFEFFFGTGQAW